MNPPVSRSFLVERDGSAAALSDSVGDLHYDLVTGEADLANQLGPLTSLEADLLILAAAVYAADRASRRGERENVCRSIEIEIPVVNVLRLLPAIRLIEEILYRLANDRWILTLTQLAGQPESVPKRAKSGKGTVLLFSGGLDSLAAAIEFHRVREPLTLISHRTRNNVVKHAQDTLAALLAEHGYGSPHIPVFVSSRGPGHDEEESQRTRSFLFLILGFIAARRLRRRRVVMLAENGQMAIHLPLTPGRVGAFSTHTAHPSVVSGMQELLGSVASVELQIVNPYLSLTKGEVVRKVTQALPSALGIANSCWRNARLTKGTHCGECVPCILRWIAISQSCADPTEYAREAWTEVFANLDPADRGRRNLSDLAEFAVFFGTRSDDDIMSEWPELYEIDGQAAIAMYRRFASELKRSFSRYPHLQPLVT
jgi:7-cyano-7-deazaguanine synthase in queuosine biosynthesis